MRNLKRVASDGDILMVKWERELRDMQKLLKKQDVLIDDVRETINHYQKALSETDMQLKLWRKRAEKLAREVEFYKKQAEYHPGRYAKRKVTDAVSRRKGK